MGMNYIQPSESIDQVAAGAGYNLVTKVDRVKIKDIRTDADGVIVILDNRDNEVTYNCLRGETLNVRGQIRVNAGGTVAYQVYL